MKIQNLKIKKSKMKNSKIKNQKRKNRMSENPNSKKDLPSGVQKFRSRKSRSKTQTLPQYKSIQFIEVFINGVEG